MGFFRKQLLDILEWEDKGQATLVYKYPMQDNEIQTGGKLVIRPGQSAVFVNEGKIADVFLEPGTYTLSTQTLPILTNLKSWAFGFKSPFKSDVYFVTTRRFLDQRWGTPQPILMPDPKFEQVEIRAFGTFSFRVMDPAKLLFEVTSTNKVYTVDDIQGQLRSYLVSNFAPIVAKQGITVAQLVQNYQVIDDAVREAVNQRFESLGLEIVSFSTQNITLQEEMLEAIRKRSSVNIMGSMENYTQVQMTEAMKESVKNPGINTMNQAGMGIGMGMAMGNMMNKVGQPQGQATTPSTPATTGQPCSKCKTVLSAGAVFCSQCGEKQPEAGNFCTKCGTANAGDAKFCAKCGTQLG